MRVLCTAGHVDHGKSTLVRALTGTDPDRWAEEKRRGLTIDLGFAWTTLDDVGQVVFVDLPGHERFVPNMLAGAGPLHVALFVVAADEGWMPQSAEHLDILRLLDVRHGVVALTRTDLVDDETVQIAQEMVAEELAASPLADAPIVAVSPVTGQGMPQLRHVLQSVLSGLPPVSDDHRPRLWVDRSFSITGAGTVVTGTLTGGEMAVGQVLHVWPHDQPVRVRGLHLLEQAAGVAPPGSRAALNLVGIDVPDVPRGSMIGVRDQWITTTTFDSWGIPAPGRTLGRKGAWTAHVGTAAVPARLFPTAGVDLFEPGGIRVELADPLPLAAGDRFILRESGRGQTAGGGQVVDPDPGPRPRGRPQRDAASVTLAAMAAAKDPGSRLTGLVTARDDLPTPTALAMAGCTAKDLSSDEIIQVGGFLMAPKRWDVLQRLAVQAVTGTHQRRPALSAVDREVPRQMLRAAGVDPDVVDAVLARTVAQGNLENVSGGVRAPGHLPTLSVAQQMARERLIELLDVAGIEADPLVDVAQTVDADPDLLSALVHEGQIVVLEDGRAVTKTVMAQAVQTLRQLQDTVGPFTASQARDALGTSRKYALPLLEALDASKTTRRDGDLRQLR